MKTRLFLTILCGSFVSVSCDRVKSLVAKGTNTVEQKIAERGGSIKVGAAKASDAPKVADPELQKLVDQSAEGAIFRKDLPFPTQLEVRMTCRAELAGRFSQSSAMGKQAAVAKATQTRVVKFERTDEVVRYTLEQAKVEVPASAGQAAEKKAAPNSLEPPVSSGKPVVFRKTGNVWGADNRVDFHAVALAKELSPVFDELLVENALVPRPLWFAKHRFKIGDELVVDGPNLPLLVAGNAKGSCTLKLEAFEPVDGHPCGVFSITGDYSRKHAMDFEGSTCDEVVTIQSGKIWFSLIYPVILREELDTIQSLKSGEQGGPVVCGQGSIKVAVTRTWKPSKR